MFIDPSKTFDSINHNVLVTKLEAHGFLVISLQLMRNYLKNRKQRVTVNSSLSEWETKVMLFSKCILGFPGPLWTGPSNHNYSNHIQNKIPYN